jgi:hypothetical protein
MKKRLDIEKVDKALRQAAHAGVYGRKDERAGRMKGNGSSLSQGKPGAAAVSKEVGKRKLEIQK